MKRPLLILLGAIIILILLGIWVYMLLTGNQENGERFAGFEFGDTTDPAVELPPEEPAEPVVDVTEPTALRQLTTDPVAGFTEVRETATSTGLVYYIEAGTGHIKTINLETGEEDRVSATTIPLTKRGVITPNGAHVLIQAGTGASAEYIIGTIATSSDELSNFALNEPVIAFAASADNRLLYAVAAGGNTIVRVYNPSTNTSADLFTIPLRDVTIDWNSSVAGPHLVYPKTASRLEGVVYSYTDGVMTRLPIRGYGLAAVGSSEYVLSSQIVNGESFESTIYNREMDFSLNLPIPLLTEKCASSPTVATAVVCGANIDSFGTNTIEQWYGGTMVMNDSLWEINLSLGVVSNLVDIQSETGQGVDISRPTYNQFGTILYFQNKIDGSLWMYDFML